MDQATDRNLNIILLVFPHPVRAILRPTTPADKANCIIVNSAELHAQSSPNTDYISPITLGYADTAHYRSNAQSQHPPDMHLPPHHMSAAHDARSAPANLVFNTTPPLPLSSPGELDLDLSPLSPWMDAYKPDSSHQRRSKRTASPHEDEQAKLARQRPSPSPRVHPTPNPTKRVSRGTKSASSTPLLRSTRAGARKSGSSGETPGDTPSPVDLSMPPPVAPASLAEFGSSPPTTNTVVASTLPTGAAHGHNITPVTPASIMNLGGLGINSGLSPPPTSATKSDAKSKSGGRGKDTANSAHSTKKGNGLSLVSPSLKPILPGKSNAFSHER
jgi:hypothetical protein